MIELLYIYPALLSCRSLKQSIICVSFRKKSNVQQFLTNVSYSGGDLLDQLCYADSNAVQAKYFNNCSQEPKGHLKQAIKRSPLKHIMDYSNEVFELKLFFNLCIAYIFKG